MERQEEKLKNNFKSLRIRAGFTQEQVAKEVGTSRTRFVVKERNPSGIRIGMLLKLSKIYNCNINDFFMNLNEPNRLTYSYGYNYVENHNHTNNTINNNGGGEHYDYDDF